ncbi:MAG: hypothetical protein UU16_C0046G0012 [Candidatus Woesebacteria bacterium GW2011_GWA2_40_7]|uniref:Type I restriction modification DNA specificity domain-containing protein n=1 Tax=Candidatus Woesebacteria bacterium GW2011_GWA2_40_7 TaxID=1618562 RepID=A0A0G0T521_9BACT|nr:MAG: hypothetical protein UU16_C0046G0012 [Candidatus Woesebacteria bacterium GW2011_GWA2_40_7]
MTNWPTKKLGEVAEVSWGNTSITKASYLSKGYAAYSATGPDGFLKDFEYDRQAIVLSAIGAKCGKFFYAQGRWTAIKNTIVIYPKISSLDVKFLFYYLNPSLWPVSGAGQPFITMGGAQKVEIKIPSTKIQQKIIKRLDAIRKAQELCDTQIQKIEELFVSQLFKEFNFNKDLDLKKLEDVATITSSKRIHQGDYVGSGIAFYRTKEIVELSQNKPISLNLYISGDQFNKIKNQFGIPKKGDILISAVGTIGISWVVSDDSEFYFKDGNLLWIKDFKEIEPTYLKDFLDYSFSSVSGLAAGGAYKALTIIKLKQFQIPLPPIAKQKETIERLDAIQDYNYVQAELTMVSLMTWKKKTECI